MIESTIIKNYIVKTFMKNSQLDITKVADLICTNLSSKFLPNETLFILSLGSTGKVVSSNGSSYLLVLPDGTRLEFNFSDLKRRQNIDFSDVCYFIECITNVTPLGRIVIENVFEKIKNPGFGSRRTAGESSKIDMSNKKDNTKSESMRRSAPKNTVDLLFNGQGSKQPDNKETKSASRKGVEDTEKKKPKLHKFETSSLAKFEIPGISFDNLKILIKVYAFFAKFSPDLRFSITELANSMVDPDTNTEVIVNVYKYFISFIEKDISMSGFRFLNDLDLLIERLPEYSEEQLPQHSKKRSVIDVENWKIQVRNFVYNIALDVGSEKVLRFLGFSKKENIDLRVEFLNFLFTVFTFTDNFKSLVHAAVSSYRGLRSNTDKKNDDENNDDSSQNNEAVAKANQEDNTKSGEDNISASILSNPLMINIGKYKNYIICFLDQKLYIKDESGFYVLDRLNAQHIVKDLNPSVKVEKSTSINLKFILNNVPEIK